MRGTACRVRTRPTPTINSAERAGIAVTNRDGMLMIVAFSLGLAATLTVLGLAVVSAGRAIARLNIPARFVTAVPALSALLIVGVGLVLTLQAVPRIA